MSCRLDGFDYTKPLFYMVTLKKRAGVPAFSEIVTPGRCQTNAITRAMLDSLRGFARQWPCVEPIECFTIMPDHLHLLLKIRPGEKRLSLPRLVPVLMRHLEKAVAGAYTMVVLGYSCYEGDVLTLTSPTSAAFTAGRVGETFACTQELSISNTGAVEISATLDRIVSKLYLVSDDHRPEGADKIRMTFGGGAKAFNPSTGLSTSNAGFSNTVNISTEVGKRSGSISYLFLNSAEQTMDVTIDVLDADDAVLYHKIVRNVPFQVNRSTKLAGDVYTATAPGATSFQLNADWEDEETITF